MAGSATQEAFFSGRLRRGGRAATLIVAIPARRESAVFQKIGREHGMITFGDSAIELIETGKNSPLEIVRVLGSR